MPGASLTVNNVSDTTINNLIAEMQALYSGSTKDLLDVITERGYIRIGALSPTHASASFLFDFVDETGAPFDIITDPLVNKNRNAKMTGYLGDIVNAFILAIFGDLNQRVEYFSELTENRFSNLYEGITDMSVMFPTKTLTRMNGVDITLSNGVSKTKIPFEFTSPPFMGVLSGSAAKNYGVVLNSADNFVKQVYDIVVAAETSGQSTFRLGSKPACTALVFNETLAGVLNTALSGNGKSITVTSHNISDDGHSKLSLDNYDLITSDDWSMSARDSTESKIDGNRDKTPLTLGNVTLSSLDLYFVDLKDICSPMIKSGMVNHKFRNLWDQTITVLNGLDKNGLALQADFDASNTVQKEAMNDVNGYQLGSLLFLNNIGSLVTINNRSTALGGNLDIEPLQQGSASNQ